MGPAALPLAFLLGLVSAVASACCTLPAMGILVAYSGTREQTNRRTTLTSTVWFLIGTTLALIVLGLVAGLVGQTAQAFLGRYWKIFAGAVAVLLGLATLQMLPIRLPKRDGHDGSPSTADIVSFDGKGPDEILRMACIAEKYSEHPLARSILTAGRERGFDIPDPDHFVSATGMGVEARWNAACIRVGKQAFLQEAGVPITSRVDQELARQSEQGRTGVLVARDDEVIGLLAIADEIRPEIPETIRQLKAMGVEKITMLTGDHPRVAEAVAKIIGVDGCQAGLLPEHKQESVRALQADGHIVGMIGDGINDAPALALADVGIAMGAAGTDVAIETADVTLMNDDLAGVVDLMWMSAKVLRRIKLNIFFSMIYNVIGLTLSVLGWMTPIIAVVFQEAGCITVVFSSTLLLWSKRSTSRLQDRFAGDFQPTGAAEPAVVGS